MLQFRSANTYMAASFKGKRSQFSAGHYCGHFSYTFLLLASSKVFCSQINTQSNNSVVQNGLGAALSRDRNTQTAIRSSARYVLSDPYGLTMENPEPLSLFHV